MATGKPKLWTETRSIAIIVSMTDTGNVVVSVLAMNSNERLHLATGFNDRDQ